MSFKHYYPGPTILDSIKLGRYAHNRVEFNMFRFADGDTSMQICTGAMTLQMAVTRENLEAMRDAINAAIEQDIEDEARLTVLDIEAAEEENRRDYAASLRQLETEE